MPAMIACKVSQCSKNDRGAEAYAAFKSVIRAFLKKGANVVGELTQLLNPPSSLFIAKHLLISMSLPDRTG
jgi:hypothetical protein